MAIHEYRFLSRQEGKVCRWCLFYLSRCQCISRQVIGASQSSGFLFVCFEQTKLKTQKTGLHADLFLNYNRQFRSPISLEPCIILHHDDSYYGEYNE